MAAAPHVNQAYTVHISFSGSGADLRALCCNTNCDPAVTETSHNPREYDVTFPASEVKCPGPLKLLDKRTTPPTEIWVSLPIEGC